MATMHSGCCRAVESMASRYASGGPFASNCWHRVGWHPTVVNSVGACATVCRPHRPLPRRPFRRRRVRRVHRREDARRAANLYSPWKRRSAPVLGGCLTVGLPSQRSVRRLRAPHGRRRWPSRLCAGDDAATGTSLSAGHARGHRAPGLAHAHLHGRVCRCRSRGTFRLWPAGGPPARHPCLLCRPARLLRGRRGRRSSAVLPVMFAPMSCVVDACVRLPASCGPVSPESRGRLPPGPSTTRGRTLGRGVPTRRKGVPSTAARTDVVAAISLVVAAISPWSRPFLRGRGHFSWSRPCSRPPPLLGSSSVRALRTAQMATRLLGPCPPLRPRPLSGSTAPPTCAMSRVTICRAHPPPTPSCRGTL